MELNERLVQPGNATTHLTLPFETRQRSRFRASLDDGREVVVRLERGIILRDGDDLASDAGEVVRVRAALEPVATAAHNDARVLARAAYHLGNRHVALQIGDGWLRYYQDHILDDLAASLGLSVRHENAPFEPEGGAYGDAGGAHGHHH